jgi:hypothetical protein
MVMGPLAGIEPTAFCIIEPPGPHDVFEGNLVDYSLAICGCWSQRPLRSTCAVELNEINWACKNQSSLSQVL